MGEFFDIIIVGGGPAGLTAAIYARRAGKSVLLLEKESFGGQIASSPCVENFPGHMAISGTELADLLYSQAENLGARIELEEVVSIEDGENKTVVTDYGSYTCKALVLATGMKHRTLGLPGEDVLGGISFCAVCDGAFHEGRDVAVVGGGNTALQDALFLADICKNVTVIHRRDTFRGDPILVEKLKAKNNVTFLMECEISALHGEGSLAGMSVRNVKTGETKEIAVTGLFEAVGQLPEKELTAPIVKLDESGFIAAGESCLTNVSGVFAAGDCRAKEVRQLTTACADGAVAALAAVQYCE